CIITILDNDQVHLRKSNACWPGRELSEPERRCQAYVHRYSRPHEISEDGWRGQGWPGHREDWKREILRSQTEPRGGIIADGTPGKGAGVSHSFPAESTFTSCSQRAKISRDPGGASSPSRSVLCGGMKAIPRRRPPL